MSRLEAAQAVNRRARRQAKRSQTTFKANVQSVAPMRLKLLHGGGQLDTDDFELSQWVRWYDREFGIDTGDTVIVMRHHGDWTVTDVIADKELS